MASLTVELTLRKAPHTVLRQQLLHFWLLADLAYTDRFTKSENAPSGPKRQFDRTRGR